MKFSVALTIEQELKSKSVLVNDLFNSINKFLMHRNYGEGINEYLITLYIVNPPLGYEHLFKDFKPKYSESKLIKNKLTGEELNLDRQFHYSIKIDGDLYVSFLNSTDNERIEMLTKEILSSFSNLDKLPKKITNFDKESFKSDIEEFCSKYIIVHNKT